MCFWWKFWVSGYRGFCLSWINFIYHLEVDFIIYVKEGILTILWNMNFIKLDIITSWKFSRCDYSPQSLVNKTVCSHYPDLTKKALFCLWNRLIEKFSNQLSVKIVRKRFVQEILTLLFMLFHPLKSNHVNGFIGLYEVWRLSWARL